MEYEKFCEDCGEYFTTTRKGAKICRSCSLERAAQANRNASAMKKANITVQPQKAFKNILDEIREYNEKTGRSLSYGQYMAMRFLESKKGKKVKKG